MSLGAALGALVTERAWELPAASASLRERWAAIAPDLAGHVAAVRYNPESGRLTVCPESTAWATKTRLERTRVIEAANKAARRTAVRALRILPPVPTADPADAKPAAPAEPTGPAKTRETACEGYRRALAAYQRAALPRRVDSGIAEAVERQTRVMGELSRKAFPEPEVGTEDAPTPIDTVRVQRRREAAATEVAALQRARTERGAERTGTAALVTNPALLRTTA
ncbi:MULTISPECIES: DUF721 domain-containing protein [unclassified Streptomyces]|uniref:DUF721 domain-containing protein n=1 Tax=unclassified Streptomyces TaxID=2593676 RepID=UPI002E32190A|nr:DUF721 domain-containing protein [Streptomyces sp. NBC_01278]